MAGLLVDNHSGWCLALPTREIFTCYIEHQEEDLVPWVEFAWLCWAVVSLLLLILAGNQVISDLIICRFLYMVCDLEFHID